MLAIIRAQRQSFDWNGDRNWSAFRTFQDLRRVVGGRSADSCVKVPWMGDLLSLQLGSRHGSSR